MLAHDSRKSLLVRARFGLSPQNSPDSAQDRLARLSQAGQQLAAALAPGGVGLITGPSGSGKSPTHCEALPPQRPRRRSRPCTRVRRNPQWNSSGAGLTTCSWHWLLSDSARRAVW